MWWPDICVETFGGTSNIVIHYFFTQTIWCIFYIIHWLLLFSIIKNFKIPSGYPRLWCHYPQALAWAHTRFKMEIVAAPPPSIDRSTHHWYKRVSSCKCLVLVQPQSPPSNLCVLMSMLGDGTAAISTLKPVCVCVHISMLRGGATTIPTLNMCVCVRVRLVLSSQFLEVEEWVKGHSAEL